MHYNLVLIGAKDTTEYIASYISGNLSKIDLIVTVSDEVKKKNDIAGYNSISQFAESNGIPVFETDDYSLKDDASNAFFSGNTFSLGICMGWQRLIPEEVLDRFDYGVFGFHGSCGYLPYGRGRSPLNWSLVNGDDRIIMNLFRYDREADSPNVFDRIVFDITEHDNIRTLQYKNMICAKQMIKKLVSAHQSGRIAITTESKDPSTWYPKRTAEDGRIDFDSKTREIYNLIRGVTHPFPGAYAFVQDSKVTIWDAAPFDHILDFSEYRPGEIIDIFDGHLVIRTIDGSLLVKDWEADIRLSAGQVMQ